MKYIFLFLTLLSFNVYASPKGEGGGDSSGGGNAVVCFKDPKYVQWIRFGTDEKGSNKGEILDDYIEHIEKIEAYDLYEAKLLREENGQDVAPEIIPIGENETPNQYVERIIRRLDFSVPTLAAWIRTSRDQIRDSIKREERLKKVDDANEQDTIGTSKRCILTTIVTQVDDSYRGSYVLHYDNKLFNHPSHSKLSKAVFRLHEYVYHLAREQSQTNSKHTRAVVGYLITKHRNLTVRKFVDHLFTLGFFHDTRRYRAGFIHEYTYEFTLINDVLLALHGRASEIYKNFDPLVRNELLHKSEDIIRKLRKSHYWFHPLDRSGPALEFYEWVLTQMVTDKISAGGAFGLSDSERTEIQRLLKSLKDYLNRRVVEITTQLKTLYKQDWQPKVLQFPNGPEEFRKGLDRAFSRRILDIGSASTRPNVKEEFRFDSWTYYGRASEPEVSASEFVQTWIEGRDFVFPDVE